MQFLLQTMTLSEQSGITMTRQKNSEWLLGELSRELMLSCVLDSWDGQSCWNSVQLFPDDLVAVALSHKILWYRPHLVPDMRMMNSSVCLR